MAGDKKWTDEMVVRAAGMKRAGMTAAQIAEKLGVTASSVQGKMARLKIKSKITGQSGRHPLKLGVLKK